MIVPTSTPVGFADVDSARRAEAVLTEAAAYFKNKGFRVGKGVRDHSLALVIPGTPNADGSLWSPGYVWAFCDSDETYSVPSTQVAPCYLRDLWLDKLPDGGPILLGFYTGLRLVSTIDAVNKRPTFRTLTPWSIKKQTVVTAVAMVNCVLQWTTKDVWVIDYSGT